MLKNEKTEIMSVEQLQTKGRLPRGDPRDTTVAQFEPRAQQIFGDLPRSNKQVHVEFREVPRSPFPLVV